MFTYDVVSESHQSPNKLAAELTRRSRDGWEVVHIAFDGKWFHAFVRHQGDVPVAPHPSLEGSTAGTWGTSASTPAAPAAPTAPTTPAAPAPSQVDAGASTLGQQSQTSAAETAAPANWYKDPSGRFEYRYWNGSQWTEHVAKGGVQSVDPPRK